MNTEGGKSREEKKRIYAKQNPETVNMERSRVLSNSSDGSSEGGDEEGFGAGHFLAGIPSHG